MAIWRKAAMGAALTLVCVLGVGYATAWLSLNSCADETFREIQRHGVRGTDMLGNRVDLSRSDVSARIAGPFLVETRHMVPYDLHGSLHFRQYVVLPWGRHERSSNVIHLVMVPPHQGG